MKGRWPGLLAIALLASGGPAAAEPAVAPAPELPQLVVEDLVDGVGAAALPGMMVIAHYTGWLYDPAAPGRRGRQFDSSREAGRPFMFQLGAGRVIQGWDQGVSGMRVGGVRRLVIPSALAYGNRNVGNGLIPPGSTLLFEIELIGLESDPATPVAQ